MATINLPALHPAQKLVKRSPARFIVLVAGRRFGKTRLGVLMCLECMLGGGRAWWVAPSYKLSTVGWRMLTALARQIPGVSVNKTDRMIEFGNGFVQIRSADDPESLRSEGLDLCVFDEAAYIRQEAWEAVRPALSDRLGRALFISSPRGRNWFWSLWMRGQNDGFSDWASFRFKTSDNPFIPSSEIEAAKQELPERIFLREYMAEFDDEEAMVFRHVTESAIAPLPADMAAHKDHQLILGIDWGKYLDFSVLALGCQTCCQMVELDRFNRIDYRFQIQRLEAMLARWAIRDRVIVCPEQNSMGTPLVEQLQASGLDVIPFITTAQSKPPLIESLALAFERGELTIQDHEILIEELKAYTITLNKTTHRATYSAPSGAHDDTVIATALMWHGMINTGLLVA